MNTCNGCLRFFMLNKSLITYQKKKKHISINDKEIHLNASLPLKTESNKHLKQYKYLVYLSETHDIDLD